MEKCPVCGGEATYVGAQMDIDCTNPNCKFYKEKEKSCPEECFCEGCNDFGEDFYGSNLCPGSCGCGGGCNNGGLPL